MLQTFGVGIGAVFTIGFLFLDILLNINYMGAVTSEGMPFMNLFWSLLVLFLTLRLILTALVFTRPKTEREIINQELKKMWKETTQRKERKVAEK